MAKTAEKHKKKPAPPATAPTPRKLKKPKYASFQLSRKIKASRLPGSFRLLWASFKILGRNWKLFLGIVIIYGLLNALFVQGFSALNNADGANSASGQASTGSWGQLASGLSLFAYLLGNSGDTVSPAAGAYQFILVLLISLALIWALRQVYAGHKIRIRDAFYSGMAPMVQFVLVLAVIGLQLIPMAVGILLYTTITSASIAATGLEEALWALLAFVLSIVSLYMVSSSIFALYVVTLPEMTPLSALRSARQLVVNRRWAVMRKVLFLPLALVVLTALIVMPFILFVAPAAAWVFFALSLLLLPVLHGYVYSLYRSLI